MFSCPLHNWYSGEAPCPACERIITSTTDGVIINTEGTSETDFHLLDKITTLQTQLDELRKENEDLKRQLEKYETSRYDNDAEGHDEFS